MSSQTVVANFFAALEDNYGRYPDILYHNNLHAADVVHRCAVVRLGSPLHTGSHALAWPGPNATVP